MMLRSTVLTVSAAPLTASAPKVSQKLRDTPNNTVA